MANCVVLTGTGTKYSKQPMKPQRPTLHILHVIHIFTPRSITLDDFTANLE